MRGGKTAKNGRTLDRLAKSTWECIALWGMDYRFHGHDRAGSRDRAKPSFVAEVPYPQSGCFSFSGGDDRQTLAEQEVIFAFLKTIEGSGLIDLFFVRNLEEARKAGGSAGA